ncbi:MAG: YhjD/YihY/BrkB family envelope integrity protein [Pseudomonadota bacterium]
MSRFVYLVVSDLTNGQLNLRAMSLVFTTILSFVPLIAVSFSVLKAFGVHDQVEPALMNLFSTLGDKAPEITENVIGFVDNIKVGLLGTIGLAFLFWSVISLLTKVEEAFNYTWKIGKKRSLTERFSNYLSVLMVGPVLVFAAMGATASLLNNSFTQSIASIEPFGTLLTLIVKLLPYLFIIIAFTFVYAFVPNTKVKFIPALTGGIAAGILWQTVGWAYALVVAFSSSKTAVYAGFAILFFFMMWLYLNWLILLVGSSIAFYRQYPEYLHVKNQTVVLNNYDREHIALGLLLIISENYYRRNPPITIEEIMDIIECPKLPLEKLLQCYEDAGILGRVEGDRGGYIPATPLEELSVSKAYSALRNSHAIFSSINFQLAEKKDMSEMILHRIEGAVESELGALTIKDLIMEANPELKTVEA